MAQLQLSSFISTANEQDSMFTRHTGVIFERDQRPLQVVDSKPDENAR